MPQEKIKNSKLATLFWVLVAICMCIIFYFSSRTADESALQSTKTVQWLIEHFGDGAITHFVVRKLAHFLEFTGLCVLFNSAWCFSTGKRMLPLSIICTSMYAATDEFHQRFVDGRSCELRDWGIDTAGAICGAVGFLVIYLIIDYIIKKKNND